MKKILTMALALSIMTASAENYSGYGESHIQGFAGEYTLDLDCIQVGGKRYSASLAQSLLGFDLKSAMTAPLNCKVQGDFRNNILILQRVYLNDTPYVVQMNYKSGRFFIAISYPAEQL